jgi:hypothetical protein
MREVPLANGRGVALVDDEDYELVSPYTWVLHKKGAQNYAIHRYQEGGKRRSLRMHRLILPTVPLIDHADGNGLNNTRANLRQADRSRNGFNIRPERRDTKSSRFKGVDFNRSARPVSRPWRAMIQAFGKRHYLGHFATPEEAAQAYDAGARQYHGEFAWFNFPDRKPIGAEKEWPTQERKIRAS